MQDFAQACMNCIYNVCVCVCNLGSEPDLENDTSYYLLGVFVKTRCAWGTLQVWLAVAVKQMGKQEKDRGSEKGQRSNVQDVCVSVRARV